MSKTYDDAVKRFQEESPEWEAKIDYKLLDNIVEFISELHEVYNVCLVGPNYLKSYKGYSFSWGKSLYDNYNAWVCYFDKNNRILTIYLMVHGSDIKFAKTETGEFYYD